MEIAGIFEIGKEEREGEDVGIKEIVAGEGDGIRAGKDVGVGITVGREVGITAVVGIGVGD